MIFLKSLVAKEYKRHKYNYEPGGRIGIKLLLRRTLPLK